jgi:hypothetical protein
MRRTYIRWEMFAYSKVERVLASVHEISPSAMGAFRGRIKHFQRLGLVPSSPGKGHKISYRLEDVYMWAICLEMQEFGIDPAIIKQFHRLENFHLLLKWLISNVDADKKNKYWVFYPNFLSQWYANTLWNSSGTFVDDLLEITDKSDPISERLKSRMAVINVARLRAAIRKSLAE